MILIIDNYDSFTYNLVQLVSVGRYPYRVVRNDKIAVSEIVEAKPNGIILSPGPGRPEEAGICVDLISRCASTIPILGVCLGHQAIGYAFGGSIVHAPVIMHGKTSFIRHDGRYIYREVLNPFEATRYHSLVISPENFPKELSITSSTEDGVIMGVRHREYPLEGIQFHPESILTTEGPKLLGNWLSMVTA